MGYLLQLIGAPLLVVGLFSIVGGAAWFFLGGDDVSVLLALAWVGPGVISVAAGIAFLREGRKKLRESGDLATPRTRQQTARPKTAR